MNWDSVFAGIIKYLDIKYLFGTVALVSGLLIFAPGYLESKEITLPPSNYNSLIGLIFLFSVSWLALKTFCWLVHRFGYCIRTLRGWVGLQCLQLLFIVLTNLESRWPYVAKGVGLTEWRPFCEYFGRSYRKRREMGWHHTPSIRRDALIWIVMMIMEIRKRGKDE